MHWPSKHHFWYHSTIVSASLLHILINGFWRNLISIVMQLGQLSPVRIFECPCYEIPKKCCYCYSINRQSQHLNTPQFDMKAPFDAKLFKSVTFCFVRFHVHNLRYVYHTWDDVTRLGYCLRQKKCKDIEVSRVTIMYDIMLSVRWLMADTNKRNYEVSKTFPNQYFSLLRILDIPRSPCKWLNFCCNISRFNWYFSL